MFLLIDAGQFCLLSYQLTAGIQAFLSGFTIPFQQCPAAVQKPLGAFHSGYRKKRGNFDSITLKDHFSVNIYEKSTEHWIILKSPAAPLLGLIKSINMTFNQSQSHGDNAFKGFRKPQVKRQRVFKSCQCPHKWDSESPLVQTFFLQIPL